MPKEYAHDPQLIYRQYLHHVLYSKIGFDGDGVGPERSALESGLADYIVASFTGAPQIYRQSYRVDVTDTLKIRSTQTGGYADRYEGGRAWAGLFWHLRQTIGRELLDKVVLAAWFELDKKIAEQSIPSEMTTKVLAGITNNVDARTKTAVIDILSAHNAPRVSQ